MTRYERVKAAIAHKKADKLPSLIHMAWDGWCAYNERLWDRYITDDMSRLCEEGKLSRLNALYYSMGNHVAILENYPWWDWYDLPAEYSGWETPGFLPKTIGRGSYEGFAQSIRHIKENTDAYVLVQIWGSDFEKAYFSRGLENFLADMAADPDYAKGLLDFITHKNLVMLENIVNIPGIDGILLGNDWGSQRGLLMSPEVWRTMIAPGAKQEYDLIHKAGIDVWVHSCGDISRVIPDLTEMGVDVLNPLQPECMDIYAMKQAYGDKITFWGGISTQRTLPNGTPDEVRAETRKVARALSQNGGYITAAAQGIQSDVPFENLCALIDEARVL